MVPFLNLPPDPRKDNGKDERCTRFKNAYSRMASMESVGVFDGFDLQIEFVDVGLVCLYMVRMLCVQSQMCMRTENPVNYDIDHCDPCQCAVT